MSGVTIGDIEAATRALVRRAVVTPLLESARLNERVGDASFCDALPAPIPGMLPFAINRRLLAGGLTVSDAEVARAMAAAFAALKIVVEPGGAGGRVGRQVRLRRENRGGGVLAGQCGAGGFCRRVGQRASTRLIREIGCYCTVP